MRMVLDASVALRRVLIEPDSDKALRLREDYRDANLDLIAPESFSLECANSLTKKERQRLIPDSKSLWDELMLDSPLYFPIPPLMSRAVEISIQTRHNVFDCLYVALAEREGCDLVTADEKLVKNLQTTFPFIKSLTTFP